MDQYCGQSYRVLLIVVTNGRLQLLSIWGCGPGPSPDNPPDTHTHTHTYTHTHTHTHIHTYIRMCHGIEDNYCFKQNISTNMNTPTRTHTLLSSTHSLLCSG